MLCFEGYFRLYIWNAHQFTGFAPILSYQAMMANLYQEEHLRRVGSPWNQPSKSRNLLHIPITLEFSIKLNKKSSKSLRVFLEALQESPALDYLKARHFQWSFASQILHGTFTVIVGGLWRAHFGEAEDQATFTNPSSSVEPPCVCHWLSKTANEYTLLVEHMGFVFTKSCYYIISRWSSSNLRGYYIERLLKMHEWFQLPSLVSSKF